MSEGFVSRGFRGRRRQTDDRLPPGQYLVEGFPVLSAGPTPRTPLDEWDFSISGEVDEPKRWTWEDFQALPSEEITRDIHCVTKWSKLGTAWEGVSIDKLLEGVEFAPDAESAARGADALVIVTEWDEFRALDLAAVAAAMRGKVLVDLRNVYEKAEAERAGLIYFGVGRGVPPER